MRPLAGLRPQFLSWILHNDVRGDYSYTYLIDCENAVIVLDDYLARNYGIRANVLVISGRHAQLAV